MQCTGVSVALRGPSPLNASIVKRPEEPLLDSSDIDRLVKTELARMDDERLRAAILALLVPPRNEVGLIRFFGHQTKGGYDGQDGEGAEAAA